MADLSIPDELLTKFRTGSKDDQKQIAALVLEMLVNTPVGSATADRDEYIQALQKRFADFSVAGSFNPGDIVVWKDGLKNKRKPDYDQPAIVIECLATPIFADDEKTGSAFYREKLDLRLGVIDPDGDFVVFHFDSSRFQKVT